MLNPNERILYLEELQPPLGFKLDRAIGTTFSLDLLSLLMAPVSMALFETRGEDREVAEPFIILEALKRMTGRFALFCQQGRITIPKSDSRLYSYLEPVVVEVNPPSNKGVFHPKVWVLRFVSEDNEVLYRFICLSRNLTFDRSWDTALVLEGLLEDRIRGFSRNRPLSDFLKAIPSMATRDLPASIGEHVEVITDEVMRVRFEPPPQFESEFLFLPSGIRGYRQQPFFNQHSRLLIFSPFLSPEQVIPLAQQGTKNVLISRQESLDALDDQTICDIAARSSVFVMDETAENGGDSESNGESEFYHSSSDTNYPPDDGKKEIEYKSDLSGLHAKLYISEKGWDARVITGSANATNAAFTGQNVEFMVELQGRRSMVGIESFLGKDGDREALRRMLRPYRRSDSGSTFDAARASLEQALEVARRTVAGAGLTLQVVKETSESYSMRLEPLRVFESWPNEISGRCYPISLRPSAAQDLSPLLNGHAISFGNLAIESLTGFIAFELFALSQRLSISFTLNLPVRGMPEERDRRILQSIISDRNHFIRYLLFLLAEGTDNFALQSIIGSNDGVVSSEGASARLELPLFEEIIRALSRYPEKIDRMTRLISDIKQTENRDKILPKGFEQMWEVFAAVRGEGGA